MRYAKQISTGLLIDGQGGGNPDNLTHLQTLKDNAISFGFPENDIEVGYCTDLELEEMLKVKNDLLQTYADKRRPLYGTWEEQLDMMYHGTWKDHVAKVKSDIPKGNS